MSQTPPGSHSRKTSLPQQGSHRVTVLSDKGHWDAGALWRLCCSSSPGPGPFPGLRQQCAHLSARRVLALSFFSRAGHVFIYI